MFDSLQPLPGDAILGLIAEHRDDPRANKIDLGVGIYRDADGVTPVLDVIKRAERQLVDTQASKAYLGTAGSPAFNAAMQDLIFAESGSTERLLTVQTPGGSGSLRVAADILLRCDERATIWASDPTWNNHIPLLGGAGVALKSYAYYDTKRHVIRFEAMLESLRAVPKGDVVLLHACCHNPSGLDPTAAQWREICEVIAERELLPFVDMAYQGFATDVNADAYVIRHLAGNVPEMIVSTSCSKNFGLYRDRVGTLTFMSADVSSLQALQSQASSIARTMYSMPPDHGAAVVSMVLGDEELRAQWLNELDAMRGRLCDMRTLFHDLLQHKAPDHDFSHLARANGMFCFLGISAEQVGRLKKEFGVYMVNSSRINVAGITADNVEYLAESIAAVL